MDIGPAQQRFEVLPEPCADLSELLERPAAGAGVDRVMSWSDPLSDPRHDPRSDPQKDE